MPSTRRRAFCDCCPSDVMSDTIALRSSAATRLSGGIVGMGTTGNHMFPSLSPIIDDCQQASEGAFVTPAKINAGAISRQIELDFNRTRPKPQAFIRSLLFDHGTIPLYKRSKDLWNRRRLVSQFHSNFGCRIFSRRRMEHPDAPISVNVVVAAYKRADHVVRDTLESTPSSHFGLRARIIPSCPDRRMHSARLPCG